MNNKVIVALLAFSALAFGQQSICDKYSAALEVSNLDLVTTVVTTTFGLLTNANSTLLEYFDGTVPAGSTNFLEDETARGNLVTSLVSFFGEGLGCTDETIAPYSGPSMEVVHKNIPIDNYAFVTFNADIIAVLAASGVTEEDQEAVAGVLESLRYGICNQPDCFSFCDKYSAALGISNNDLVTSVVTSVFTIVSNTTNPLVGFFNGTVPPGSTDFLNNPDAVAILANGLVTFFGAALNCTDNTIGPYTGPSMTLVHKDMPINNFAFTTFNGYVAGVLAAAGVSADDLAAAGALLESLRPEICNQPDCDGLTTEETTAEETTAAEDSSSFALVPSVLLALFAYFAF